MPSRIEKTEEEWRAQLTPDQFDVLRQHGTEPPFTGMYDKFFERGTYVCVACHNPLFHSASKFDAGCGWPSFDKVVSDAIEYHEDVRFGMRRIEFRCARCGGHLGHIFDDGPSETGQRYCTNSNTLLFVPEGAALPGEPASDTLASV